MNGSTVSLSWRAPSTTGLNGGKIDASTCTYSVVRYPDMKQVASNITGTNVTDELPDPDVYTEYYYVLSTLAGTATAPDVTSAKIGVGPVEPPHTWAFNSSAAVGEWTYEGKKPTYSSYYTALSLDASWESFDDWIFSPAVAVKNGGIYPVALTIFGGDNYMTEDVEVKWGTAPTAEAMTNTVVESTQYSGSDEKELTGELTSSVTGKIYIGVHISTTTSSYAEIYYKSVTIGEGVITGAPEAPAEFNAEATAPGAHNVAVSFNIPQYNVGGAPLADDNAITKVEIVRDGTPIYTLSEGIVPGAKVEYTDMDVAVGTHTYAALAYNNYGEGEKASKELFVGVAKPLAPASVVMIEDGNTGSVTLTWDPVVTGVDDSTLPEGSVTYRVINRSYETVADKIEDTTLTIQAVDGDTQAFVQFGVYAVTEGGESENMTATQYKPAGKPYTAPWKESFANENVSSIWGYNYIKGSERWQFIASMSDFNLQPQDDDHGFAYFEVDGGSLTSLVSGKIDLSTIASPAFSYYTFNYNGLYNNTLTLEVDKNDGKGFVAVQSNVVAQTGPVGQWNKVVVPLKDFEGETVVFRITPSVPEMIFYTLDNLRVATHAEKNLSITKISAPTVAEVNKPFEVEVNVTNSGDKSMSAYSVELLNGENVIATVTPSSLEPDATRTSTFEVTLGITDGEYAYLSARIVSTEDMVETDNISEVVEVGINTPKTPVVTDLKAISRSTAVELTWSEPDLDSALPAAYTETFESATSWNSIVEGWKFYDKDDTPVGGIETPGFPCTGLQSWFVADHSWNGFPTNAVGEWAAHSGEKFLASEYVVKGNTFVQSDDWAITPRLSTVSQVLSFYAKSFKKEFPETIEVLASSNTTNVDDFVSLYTFNNLPVAWTQIRVKLPEGTKYAAIRSRSIDRFFVFVDDVTFIPSEGTPEELVISGYNVYRNGVKITAKPVTATTYSDTAGSDTAEYFVTTVYTTGESGASNTAIPEVDSSLKDLTDNDNVTISATGGVVTVKGLTEGYVTITAIDGRTIFKCEAQPVVNVPLASGVYIVSAGNKVAKLLVK